MEARRPHSLLVTDEPDRAKLRDLEAALDALLDAIAGLEVTLDEARARLAKFEQDYEDRLRVEQAALSRVHGVLRHFERWASLLDSCRAEDVTARAERIDAQRDRE